jgi:hypothetical protein
MHQWLSDLQEHHAMLVVQQAKEINELRYVLCPKRMTDAQFWHIYFQLAKKYLPAEAFDSSYVPACSTTPGMSITDLQVAGHQFWISSHDCMIVITKPPYYYLKVFAIWGTLSSL